MALELAGDHPARVVPDGALALLADRWATDSAHLSGRVDPALHPDVAAAVAKVLADHAQALRELAAQAVTLTMWETSGD